jgi:hypothetical protein
MYLYRDMYEYIYEFVRREIHILSADFCEGRHKICIIRI